MPTVGETLIGDVNVFVENYNRLERRCKELEKSNCNVEKFYAVAFDIDTVAKLHGVSKYLVRSYINLGLIDKHPNSTDARFLVRASDALILDFKDLREQAKMIKEKRKWGLE